MSTRYQRLIVDLILLAAILAAAAAHAAEPERAELPPQRLDIQKPGLGNAEAELPDAEHRTENANPFPFAPPDAPADLPESPGSGGDGLGGGLFGDEPDDDPTIRGLPGGVQPLRDGLLDDSREGGHLNDLYGGIVPGRTPIGGGRGRTPYPHQPTGEEERVNDAVEMARNSGHTVKTVVNVRTGTKDYFIHESDGSVSWYHVDSEGKVQTWTTSVEVSGKRGLDGHDDSGRMPLGMEQRSKLEKARLLDAWEAAQNEPAVWGGGNPIDPAERTALSGSSGPGGTEPAGSSAATAPPSGGGQPIGRTPSAGLIREDREPPAEARVRGNLRRFHVVDPLLHQMILARETPGRRGLAPPDMSRGADGAMEEAGDAMNAVGAGEILGAAAVEPPTTIDNDDSPSAPRSGPSDSLDGIAGSE